MVAEPNPEVSAEAERARQRDHRKSIASTMIFVGATYELYFNEYISLKMSYIRWFAEHGNLILVGTTIEELEDPSPWARDPDLALFVQTTRSFDPLVFANHLASALAWVART